LADARSDAAEVASKHKHKHGKTKPVFYKYPGKFGQDGWEFGYAQTVRVGDLVTTTGQGESCGEGLVGGGDGEGEVRRWGMGRGDGGGDDGVMRRRKQREAQTRAEVSGERTSGRNDPRIIGKGTTSEQRHRCSTCYSLLPAPRSQAQAHTSHLTHPVLH
jgi:hypothetical protein